jgi:tRNA 5-methylaminomethyl-2-thiouridine biosynthesis bifunctional protein
MRFQPVVPAQLRFDHAGRPVSPVYGDVYHPAAGPAAQAEHVFLRGNGLPQRWRGRAEFVVLETGFGLGNNFLATWNAWRLDAQRTERLHFISVERHPFRRADLEALHAASPWPDLAAQLLQAWPPLTPDLHALDFDAGRVRLLLALGDAAAWLPQLVASVDAFYLDGFAPACNPELWAAPVYKALARLAAPQASLATWSAARVVRDGLRAAGFGVTPAPGTGGKRDITLARFDPAWTPKRPPARPAPRAPGASAAPGTRADTFSAERRALIVGAGLAGCATAWALAQRGWTSVVIERHAQAACEASGNPAGTFHGVVNRDDGTHARFNRAAALLARTTITEAIAEGGVPGSVAGLLRLDAVGADVVSMRALLARLGLPDDYVRALNAAQAGALAGVPLDRPGWFYPGGGWVDPAQQARWLLNAAGSRATFRSNTSVAALHRAGASWELLDATGQRIEIASTVVLANAGGALALLEQPEWPLQCTRGQISRLSEADLVAGIRTPGVALSGSGFVVPASDGIITFGATSSPIASAETSSSAPSEPDHAANLARLRSLWDPGGAIAPHHLSGRVGWRWSADDRLPLVGSVPIASPGRRDQPRFIERQPGLYVLIGLGSRGITWAPLAAQVLAALIGGGPVPLPADLLDAIDPARFMSRRFRRRERTTTGVGGALPSRQGVA